jgi:hypothetical protein
MVLLMVAGLAAFTRHAMLVGPLSLLTAWGGLVAVGLLLGVELVTAKVRRTANWTERADAVAAGIVGALLATSLAGADGDAAPPWLAVPGAVAALVVRLGRWRVVVGVRDALRPWGHVAVGIGADVLAGAAVAALFAVKP